MPMVTQPEREALFTSQCLRAVFDGWELLPLSFLLMRYVSEVIRMKL